MIELTLPWKPIKALLNVAADKDVRYYLRGVWIDSAGPERIVWATNGTALGAWRTDEPSTELPPILMPRDTLERVKCHLHTVTVKIDGHKAAIEYADQRHEWQHEDLRPPEWRRPFPREECSGPALQFDAEQIGRFFKVRKDLGRKAVPSGVRIAHCAPAGVGLVSLAEVPEFAGVISCINYGAKNVKPIRTTTPDWVCAPLAEPVCDLA